MCRGGRGGGDVRAAGGSAGTPARGGGGGAKTRVARGRRRNVNRAPTRDGSVAGARAFVAGDVQESRRALGVVGECRRRVGYLLGWPWGSAGVAVVGGDDGSRLFFFFLMEKTCL